MSETPESLALRWQRGDRVAGDALVLALDRWVRFRVWKLAASCNDREDIQQVARAEVARASKFWRAGKRRSLRVYLTAWIDGAIMAHIEREKPMRHESLVTELTAAGWLARVRAHAETQDRIEVAMSGLSERERNVFSRRFLTPEPESRTEVARDLSLSADTVRRTERAAVRKVAKALGADAQKAWSTLRVKDNG